MKILFITYYFPPYNCIGSLRTGKTAQKLLEMGNDVLVVTTTPEGLKKDLKIQFPENRIFPTRSIDFDHLVYSVFNAKTIDSIKHLKIDKRSNIKSKVKKILYELYRIFTSVPDRRIGWFITSYKKILNESKKFNPDIIYSSATPFTSHIIARFISSKLNTPWIAEFRDLWSDNPFSTNKTIERTLEKWTLKKAAGIITVSEPHKTKMLAKGYINIETIYNGFDKEDFKTNDSINIKKKNQSRILITHTGNIFPKFRDPELLFQTISKSKSLQKKVLVQFIGPKSDFIEKLAHNYRISKNIAQIGSVSRDQSLSYQRNSDILLLLKWNNPQDRGHLSGKLFEYIGSRKPILSIGKYKDDTDLILDCNRLGKSTTTCQEIKCFIQNYKSIIPKEDNSWIFERMIQIEKLNRFFIKVLKNYEN